MGKVELLGAVASLPWLKKLHSPTNEITDHGTGGLCLHLAVLMRRRPMAF